MSEFFHQRQRQIFALLLLTIFVSFSSFFGQLVSFTVLGQLCRNVPKLHWVFGQCWVFHFGTILLMINPGIWGLISLLKEEESEVLAWRLISFPKLEAHRKEVAARGRHAKTGNFAIDEKLLFVFYIYFRSPSGFFCFLLVCCFWTGTLVCRNFLRWQLSRISSASWLAWGEAPPLPKLFPYLCLASLQVWAFKSSKSPKLLRRYKFTLIQACLE